MKDIELYSYQTNFTDIHNDNNEYKKLNPPFGYFGSKNLLAKKICKDLPPHNCWVEAFCGSASLTLSKPPSLIDVINDIDDEIYNLFEQLQNNSVELCRLIALTPYARVSLEKAREIKEKDSDLEKARKFLVKAMMAINGAFGESKGGFSYSLSYTRGHKDARVNRWYNLPERLHLLTERLKHILIEKKDAIDLIKIFSNRPATLLYLDPPYYADRAQGYSNDANNEDFHKNMLNEAVNANCMVFISGYENELYKDTLTTANGWVSREIESHTKNASGKRFVRKEVLWMNNNFVQAQNTGEIPVELTPSEIKYKKVNPTR